MSNEIIAISIPQMQDDIDIFEDVKAILFIRGFVYLDMLPQYDSDNLVYRFQREE